MLEIKEFVSSTDHRFDMLIHKYYHNLENSDLDFIDLNDFLEFIPNDDFYSLGMARLLWKRYIASFTKKY